MSEVKNTQEAVVTVEPTKKELALKLKESAAIVKAEGEAQAKIEKAEAKVKAAADKVKAAADKKELAAKLKAERDVILAKKKEEQLKLKAERAAEIAEAKKEREAKRLEKVLVKAEAKRVKAEDKAKVDAEKAAAKAEKDTERAVIKAEKAEVKAKLDAERAEAKAKRDAVIAVRDNAEIFVTDDKTIMSVSVTRSLAKGATLLEAASGFWKMAELETFKRKTVLTEERGMITGVFNLDNATLHAESVDGPNRYWLDLSAVSDEEAAKFIGKRIFKLKGAAGPICYIFKAAKK